MKLLDLKMFEDFREQKNVKVLRHFSSKKDLWELYRIGKFESYQNTQSWDVFGPATHIISFIAERDKFAKFIGVWEVLWKRKRSPKGFIYKTARLDGYDNLVGRLVVQWGEGTRSWAQWLHKKGNKPISEILPPDYVMDFPGYYDFILSYSELCQMIKNPDSNREWYRMLSSISGVYVILDKATGDQYVGSAYGKDGIWRRWKSYARNPSGGNKLIKKLLSQRPLAYESFQFSILRVLEPSSTKDEAIKHESLIKRKLGSRAFGLNVN